ncbi:MAG: hypothetical protein P4L99_11890 [Chthoniobacter sp.]|nr:hypothetical protein [Chthoniobacter sp.]
MKPYLALFLTALLAAHALADDAVAPDTTARFLAGLPVRDTPLEVLCRNQSWVDHATEFDKAWKELDARQLAKIRAWSSEFLADAAHDKGPMFYMFSGPDILYAQAFFPNASTYVLAGLEPVGTIPDVQHLQAGALASGLGNLRKSLNSVLSFSFFITKDMKVDLHQNALSGTLPILYVFLERAGCKIDSVELVWLDKAGAVSTTKAPTAGVKIVFFGPSGAQQTLYYFSTDLSNEGIKSQPGYVKFCESLGTGRALLKAASYLPHSGNFTTSRDFLLTHCSTIVQDDSGIPIKDYNSAKWALRYFGSYPGPIDMFKKDFQPDLAAIYKTSHPPALPFGFGYRWHPSQSSLILATARVPQGDTSPTPKPATTPAP